MAALGGLILSAMGGLLIVAGTRRLITAVSVHRNEAIPVRYVAKSEGLVEFDGQAAPLSEYGMFEAPFSGTDALCCEVWMQAKNRHRTDTEGLEVGDSREPENYRNTAQSWLLAETADIRYPFAVVEGGTRVAVDPDGADLDITGHMGETVLTIEPGESLPDAVRERLETLDTAGADFDGSVETWTRIDDRVTYREARVEPGDPIHVSGGTVESGPDEWGSDVAATVGGADADGRFVISEGTESTVIRNHLIQFLTGVVVGLALLGLGLYSGGWIQVS